MSWRTAASGTSAGKNREVKRLMSACVGRRGVRVMRMSRIDISLQRHNRREANNRRAWNCSVELLRERERLQPAQARLQVLDQSLLILHHASQRRDDFVVDDRVAS